MCRKPPGCACLAAAVVGVDRLTPLLLGSAAVIVDRSGRPLHDALPIFVLVGARALGAAGAAPVGGGVAGGAARLGQGPGGGLQVRAGVDRGRARLVVGVVTVGLQRPGGGGRAAAVVGVDRLAQVQLGLE